MKLVLLFLIPVIYTLYEGSNVNTIGTYEKLRATKGNLTINKPLFHFSPSYGWMNDPNGCWYDKSTNVWHLYYQYNPQGTKWGTPLYWGHAISYDLNSWQEKGLAIGPPNGRDGVFSGSIYIDSSNLSGFFDGVNEQNVIAMWTYNYDDEKGHHQNQWLSFSRDGGYNFVTPSNETQDAYNGAVINPVATAYYKNSDGTNGNEQMEFRDPQVIKYYGTTADGSEDRRFIMTVARSQQYAVDFYESEDGVKFTESGSFEFGGFLGHQYECPNMCHLKNTEKQEGELDSYWILFVSINPGSILGGSSTWYVIGTFGREGGLSTNKFVFTQTHKYLNIFDYGKDFYAMQLYYVNPDNDEQLTDGYESITGITWASNWQYAALVPTDPWRSSMGIPREFYLSHFKLNDQVSFLTLKQKPVLKHPNFSPSIETLTPITINELSTDSANRIMDFSEGANGAFEFLMQFNVTGSGDLPEFYALFRGGSIPEEYLRFGYYDDGPQFWLDRGHTRVQFVQDFGSFTHRIQMYSLHLNFTYNLYGLIDRNIIELFLNVDDFSQKTSYVVSTNTFFFTGGNFVSTVELVPVSQGRFNISFYGRQLGEFDFTEPSE